MPKEFRSEILQFHLPHTSNQRLVLWIAKRDMKLLKHLKEGKCVLQSKESVYCNQRKVCTAIKGKCVLQSKYTEEVTKTRKQNILWRLIAKIRRERHFILS
jgi:hypothetical protein